MAAAALSLASPAHADLVVSGQVEGARIATGAGSPAVAYVSGSNVHLAGVPWRFAAVGFPGPATLEGFAHGARGDIVLARARDGSWLCLWDGKRRCFHRDSRQAVFGRSGLTLDLRGEPVVAYALWYRSSHRSFLRLAHGRSDGTLSVRAVTKKGFPESIVPPAAAPVVLSSGEIRAVETFAPGTIAWRLTGWGKLLFSSALGLPSGAVAATASSSTLYAAWTEAFPTLGPPAVILATQADRVRSGIAVEDAVLANLTLAPEGPELAVNRCIPAAAFGADGNGICGGLIGDVGVDGVIADYVAAGAERRLLLQRDDGLYWFTSLGPLTVRVELNRDLSGRVVGRSSGTITIYRERPGEPRVALGQVPLAPDGTFSLPAPADPIAAAYRAVYTEPGTGIPYAALAGP